MKNPFRTKEDLRPVDDDAEVSSEFTCICGKQKGWITSGKVHTIPCPECGRVYRGQYNPKTLGIDAIEIGTQGSNAVTSTADRDNGATQAGPENILRREQ